MEELQYKEINKIVYSYVSSIMKNDRSTSVNKCSKIIVNRLKKSLENGKDYKFVYGDELTLKERKRDVPSEKLEIFKFLLANEKLLVNRVMACRGMAKKNIIRSRKK